MGEAKCRTLALLENMDLRQSTVFQAPYAQYNCILTFLSLAKVGLAKQYKLFMWDRNQIPREHNVYSSVMWETMDNTLMSKVAAELREWEKPAPLGWQASPLLPFPWSAVSSL